MENVLIITDSNSGISQKEAASLGIKVIPMPFTINDTDYYEDVNLTNEQFYEKLKEKCEIHTSQPSPQVVLDIFEDAMEHYKEAVYIPMSSGLSSSYQTAVMLAEDFDDRVVVVNNKRISVTMKHSVMDALKLANRGMSAKEIKKCLEEDSSNSSIYIMLETLEYLKKGGRLTTAAAMLAQLLKIKPVLQIQGDKLDAFSKVRTVSQAKSVMINQARKDIVNKFGCNENGKGVTIYSVYSNNYEAALSFKEDLQKAFPYAGVIIIDRLSLSISCHIGPDSLAIAIVKNTY